VSHYYLGTQPQMKAAFAEYVDQQMPPANSPADNARRVTAVQDAVAFFVAFLDSEIARKHRIRIDVPEPVLPRASVTGAKP
jgi:hypothetical protein